MAAPTLKYALGNAASTTSSSSITGVSTAIPLSSTSNFNAKSGEGMAIIEEGGAAEEFAYSTGLSGSSLTIPVANRGLEGGSSQAHDANVSVKGIISAGMWNGLIDSLLNVLVQSSGAVDTTKIVTPSGSQSLTNKTITDSTNDVMAKSLKSATTTVDVSAATAPSSGQVLTATGASAATWQTPGSGKSMFFTFANNAAISSGQTLYAVPCNFGDTNATETNRQQLVPAMTLREFGVYISANTLNNNVVFTVRDTASNTTLTKTVSSGTTGAQTVSSTVSVSANARLAIKIDTTAAGSGSVTILGGYLVYQVT